MAPLSEHPPQARRPEVSLQNPHRNVELAACTCISALRRWRQGDSWGSLAIQSNPVGNYRPVRDPVSKEVDRVPEGDT